VVSRLEVANHETEARDTQTHKKSKLGLPDLERANVAVTDWHMKRQILDCSALGRRTLHLKSC